MLMHLWPSRGRLNGTGSSPPGSLFAPQRDLPSARLAGGCHVEGEHPVGMDTRINRAGVEELFPLRSIAWHVNVKQGLSQLSFCVAMDVDRQGATVHGHGEFFPGQVSRTDMRSPSDVPEAQRIRCRTEVESAAKEDAVHRPDDWSPIGGDGRQRQQAYPGQALGDLLSTQPPLRGDNAEQVPPSSRVAAVEEVLQRGEVSRRLVHVTSEPAAPAPPLP